MIPSFLVREIELALDPQAVVAAFRRPGFPTLFLDGRGGFPSGWGPLLAVDPVVIRTFSSRRHGCAAEALELLDRALRDRRRAGAPPGTGVAALLAYDLMSPAPIIARRDESFPDVVLLSVDASIRFGEEGATVAARRAAGGQSRERFDEWMDRIEERVRRLPSGPPPPQPVPASGGVHTSLPRELYLDAIRTVQRHIRAGDIYQANITQRFHLASSRDAWDLYRLLVATTPAPCSAFFEAEGIALVSASPEIFLRVSPNGVVETWPIKGTRRRGETPEEDRVAAESLLSSAKDRAELLMIVDLERNDLGRVCRTGTVEVRELAALRSYAAVHHLVSGVSGLLRPDVGPAELLRATFPGGSVTGAPKIRAMEILAELEPARRGFYTGSLLWFGDDGSVLSSILIRSIVLDGTHAFVGAGGGVVADSEPEAEWIESNDKARALARVLGFDPEEAV